MTDEPVVNVLVSNGLPQMSQCEWHGDQDNDLLYAHCRDTVRSASAMIDEQKVVVCCARVTCRGYEHTTSCKLEPIETKGQTEETITEVLYMTARAAIDAAFSKYHQMIR